jgi:hypothetical protein
MQKLIESFDQKTDTLINIFEEQIEEEPPPPIIFHYTNDIGLRGTLETGKLWLTDIFDLNDPSELRHGCHPAIELIIKENNELPEQFVSKLSSILLEGNIEEVAHFFVCSFSAAGDDLGQWRAYADNGRGYAIGFDTHTLEQAFAKQGPGHMTFPIKYDENTLRQTHSLIVDEVRPLISLFRGRNLRDPAINHYMSELLIHLSLPIIRASLFFKHDAYSNEQEYRFLELFDASSTVPDLKYRSRSHSLVRYREFDWRSLAGDCLKEIVVGPAADRGSRFVNDCLRLYHAGAIKISHSKIPYRAV